MVRTVSFTSRLRWELPICAGEKEIPRTDRGKGGLSVMFQCATLCTGDSLEKISTKLIVMTKS